MEKRKKKKAKNSILNIVVIVIVLALLFLIWELAKVLLSYAENRREYEELRSQAVLVQEDAAGGDGAGSANGSGTGGGSGSADGSGTGSGTGSADGFGSGAGSADGLGTGVGSGPADGSGTAEASGDGSLQAAEPVCPISVDFETLWETNEDIKGWLYLEALDISYPIVQAQDNDKYLHTSVKGTANSAGSIFIDAWNHDDFNDPHTIIYGHNMKNGSMFGSLKKLKKQETVDQFVEDTGTALGFWIITPKEQYRYDIFSIHTVAAVGDTYALFSQADAQYLDFVNRMAKGTGITLPRREYTESDRVVTLSTCTGNDEYRLVVQGIRASD